MCSEAIILAGGLGTRLRSVLPPDIPKPMAPVNGKPFLAHQIEYWQQQGIKSFILSVGHKYEAIQKYFGKSYRGAEIAYSIEDKPLGTGGGVVLATNRLKQETFLLLNGDTYFDIALGELQKFHKTNCSDFTISLGYLRINDRYSGVRVGSDNRITGFFSRGEPKTGCLINAGVYLVEKHALNKWMGFVLDKPVSLEDQVIPEIINGFWVYMQRSLFH